MWVHILLRSLVAGDGGYFNDLGDPFNFAQNGQTFLGKVLRLDISKSTKTKNYTIPVGNPFKNNALVRPEIFSLGLRQPWRCSVDSIKGTIICSDVGQVSNSLSLEEDLLLLLTVVK